MTTRIPVRRWMVLAIAASGLFLICVDLTVLYVALPALTRDLAASNSAKLWILNAYPIVVAGLLPGLGTLGDRHGHRRLFLIGLADVWSRIADCRLCAELQACSSPRARFSAWAPR